MDNRFSKKDFFLYLILFILFLTLIMAMYMIDRQWSKMTSVEAVLTEQAADIRRLRQSYAALNQKVRSVEGIASAPTRPVGEIPESFQRAFEVTQRPDYAEGDWLVQSFGSNLATISPLVSTDVYASSVQSDVLETLLKRDSETLEWEGLLADSWEISDDGLTITFRLRPEATFSDGVPVTVDDVVFTYDFIMDPRIKAPRQRAYLEKIASVKAVDAQSVEFKFKEPYFNSLTLAGGMDILARHFYEPYLEKPEEYNRSKGLLFGSGPYRLADAEGWTPDQGMVELVRNERYWAPVQPSFDRVMWKIIENETARLTSFRNGEIDVYPAQPREYKNELLKDEKLMARSQRFEYTAPTAGYRYIGWNQKRKGVPTKFADRRVRLAMTYLTDKQRIIDEIMLGYGEPAVGPFNPLSKQHNPDLKPREFSVEKAKNLLLDAGYEDRDGDGVLEDGQGRPFTVELVYPQGSEQYKSIVLFLKDSYARAGVQLIGKPTEWSVMLELLDKKDFEAISLGWSGELESDPYQIFHSSQMKNNGDNFINYSNPRLDELIEKARSTVDENIRMPLWHEVEKILYDDQPYTFLARGKSLVLVDQRMKNVKVTPVGLNLGELPVSWYVPLDQQRYQ